MFSGQTGVGKTELAKQLALFCDMKLLKYDMSEFSEASSVSKLLGSAPGYAGFDQGAMLTDEVDKYPYSVVLFDEIEKANHEIYNLLLQIMDEGIITDSTGKKVKFSNCIIILTSNVSVGKMKSPIGFSNTPASQIYDQFDREALNSEFSIEFRIWCT
jgi:ATP-dependent Clp protease ATP-binding subunit ClpA